MADAAKWTEHSMDVAGCKLHVTRGGKGAPLLILHHDFGTPDKLAIYDELAKTADVIIPHHPGWGKSPRADWMRSVRDIAVVHRGLLAELGLSRANLLGLGFGGWIAAEMATMGPKDFGKMVLVGPMGIKPDGEEYILDQAIVSYIDYARAAFETDKAFKAVYGDVTTDQLEAWDIAREMCFRLAWKPYMYSQTLPHLAAAVKTETLIVWGDKDKVVPISVAGKWQKALPKTRLEIVKGSGHAVDMEKPDALAKLVKSFLG